MCACVLGLFSRHLYLVYCVLIFRCLLPPSLSLSLSLFSLFSLSFSLALCNREHQRFRSLLRIASSTGTHRHRSNSSSRGPTCAAMVRLSLSHSLSLFFSLLFFSSLFSFSFFSRIPPLLIFGHSSLVCPRSNFEFLILRGRRHAMPNITFTHTYLPTHLTYTTQVCRRVDGL
jgi:hypothetical protein